ncbi:hypothetical protein BDZ97DRAFT_1918014 [Flammula alnicola]|nr:hypothetical protein BDZ97DRAFT_1918014 [Flammula alnicola]
MVNELVNDVDPETIKPKLWRWNDPHLYPIPKPGGDHCDTVLQPLLKKDKIQCDAWKDEVQNLLIFAGLFSAVVTGFAIDSYKRLQPDPNVVLTALLTHIAGSVDILANTSMAAIPPSNIQYPVSFSPSPSSIRINIFWFSSLILSLTTVIVGIVSLQWLREHQRYTDPLSSKQALAIFHMRAKGLEKWHIPLIFTGLPLLLQGAVVLFFVGVVEFLVALQLIVAIPVTLFIGIAIVFLVTTTFLPTIQLFKASLAPSSETTTSGPRMVPLALCLDHAHRNWIDFDVFWLQIRDANFLVTHGESVFLDDHIRPPYDLVQALALAIKDHSAKEELVLAAYHAYRALSLAIVNPQLTNPSTRLADQDTPSLTRSQIRTLQSCFFPSSKFRPMTSTLRKPSLQMMHNESMFLFLYLPGISVYSDNPAHMIGIHRVELHTRIWVLNSPHRQRDSFENVTVDSGHPFLLQKNYLIPVPRKIPDGLLQGKFKRYYNESNIRD